MAQSVTPPLESFEAYRAALRLSRLTTISTVVLGLVTLALASVLMTLFPLKTVQPMLVTFRDKGEQIVRIEPLEKNVQALAQLQETLARHYVQWRETFDLQTEQERWKQMTLMSSDALAADFQNGMNPQSPVSPYRKRLTEGTTRSVRIVSSACLAPSAPDVYQVEWVSEDRHQGQVVGTAHWLSTLTATLEERTFDHADQYINPLGFTVTHYTVARKTSDQPEEGHKKP